MRSWPRAGSLVREVGDFPNRKQSNSLQLAIVLRTSTLLDCFSYFLASRVARKQNVSSFGTVLHIFQEPNVTNQLSPWKRKMSPFTD